MRKINKKKRFFQKERFKGLAITWILLKKDHLTMLGLIIVLFFAFLAITAPFIAPYPDEGMGIPKPENKFLQPSLKHLFGTDYLGRDVLSRIIFGTRISLLFAIVSVGLAVIIGSPLGSIAGYIGGKIDELIMRVTDIFLSFPPLLLAIALVATLGPGLTKAMIAIAFTWWPWYTRLTRAQAVSLRELPFIESAKAIGVNDFLIILRHILPNSLTPIIVQATLDMSSAILVEAGLSFLGLGAQAPEPSWGLMVSTGRAYLLTNWWFPTFPGLAIFTLALAFNLLGDGMREILDPKLRRIVRS